MVILIRAFYSALIIAIVIILCVRLHDDNIVGHDEKYEFTKASLLYDGHVLYQEIWNDQPPLHSIILNSFFKISSKSIASGRVLAILFGISMLTLFGSIMYERYGAEYCVFGQLLLISSKEGIILFISSMLECPAMVFGLASIYFCYLYRSTNIKNYLRLSGLILGAGFQVKLSIIIFIPTIGLLLIYKWPTYKQIINKQIIFCNNIVFLSYFIISYLVIYFLVPSMELGNLIFPHARVYSSANMLSAYRFDIIEFFLKPSSVAIFLGLVIVRKKIVKDIDILAPIIFLTFVLIAHCNIRPYWAYYDIHLALASSWIALSIMKSFFIQNNLENIKLKATNYVVFFVLISSLMFDSIFNLEKNFKILKLKKEFFNTNLVNDLIANGCENDVIFTKHTEYAFAANLTLPPNLAIIPKKRILFENLTDDIVISELKKINPRFLLLDSSEYSNNAWVSFLLEKNYNKIGTYNNLWLFDNK